MPLSIETNCLHLENEKDGDSVCSHYGAISFPIYQTATYAHPGDPIITPFLTLSRGYNGVMYENLIFCSPPLGTMYMRFQLVKKYYLSNKSSISHPRTLEILYKVSALALFMFLFLCSYIWMDRRVTPESLASSACVHPYEVRILFKLVSL